ncbi:MAG: MFS transporter [Pelosinus sp.]|nr:MFS transporter [Pelosinus sp.]
MKKYIQKDDVQYWQTIFSLFLGSFVTFAIFYCTQPLIPIFSKEFDIMPATASLSVSFPTACMALFMLVMAWLSDAKGRKMIMTISLVGSTTLAVLSAFCTNFTLLLFIRALQGIMLAGFPGIAMAYINEEFHPSCVALVMGIYVSGTSIGGLLGRLIVSTLSDFFSWHIALAVLSVITLLSSLYFWFHLPTSQNSTPHKDSLPQILAGLQAKLRDSHLLPLYFMGFILLGSFVALYNYIGYPLMAAPYNLSQTIVGFIFLVYLCGTFSSTFMGKLAGNIGNAKVLCLGIIIMFAGVLITLAASLLVKITGVAIFTFGFFGSHAVASGWVGQCAKKGKAQASCLYLMFFYLGSSILGAAGGKFLTWLGWPGVVLLISAFLMLGLIISGALLLRETGYLVHAKQNNLSQHSL